MIPTFEGVVRDGQVHLKGAPVLPDGTRVYVTIISMSPGLSLSDPTADELARLAMEGGAFDWLQDEPDLYTDADLEERFEWPT